MGIARIENSCQLDWFHLWVVGTVPLRLIDPEMLETLDEI